jgi:hypothetical protein
LERIVHAECCLVGRQREELVGADGAPLLLRLRAAADERRDPRVVEAERVAGFLLLRLAIFEGYGGLDGCTGHDEDTMKIVIALLKRLQEAISVRKT